eukprot:11228656-Ditylum_brightwellii.AAC.1
MHNVVDKFCAHVGQEQNIIIEKEVLEGFKKEQAKLILQDKEDSGIGIKEEHIGIATFLQITYPDNCCSSCINPKASTFNGRTHGSREPWEIERQK